MAAARACYETRGGGLVRLREEQSDEDGREEQNASWGEGERELWKEERGGGGEGYWEGGRVGGRSRTGV